jgi:erythromycin esterase-like protein
MLNLDAPMLAQRLGSESVASARMIARDLAQMADFNGGGPPVSHSRDYYMAANILSAMRQFGPRAKTIFWAHNAHVSHPTGQSESGRSTVAWLRALLGCDYAALGVTFGKGAFVAQIPNDSADRLAVSSLPFPDSESVENVFRHIGPAGAIATWGCDTTNASAPVWLNSPQKMHWVGALFAPGTLPNEAVRSYSLLKDFDALAFIPEVTADDLPATRPVVPARRAR